MEESFRDKISKLEGDELIVFNAILDDLVKPISEEMGVDADKVKESVISLIDKGFIEIVADENDNCHLAPTKHGLSEVLKYDLPFMFPLV